MAGVGRKLKREGTYVHLWLIHVDVWQRPTQHCNYPPIKNKYIFLKNHILHENSKEGDNSLN